MDRAERVDQPRSGERKWLWLYGAAMFAASVLFTGYRVNFHNQSLQIPLLHLLNDRGLYPNDPFAATLPHYASGLWWVVAWKARVIGLEPVLLAAFLLERALLIYAAARLAMALAPNSRAAAVGTMAFFALSPRPLLGGGTIVMPYFEQTGFAIPFLLLAIAAFYESRAAWWALWMGIAFNCNSMYATYAMTFFAAAFVFDKERLAEWKRWLGALGGVLVLATPSALLTVSAFGKAAVDDRLWLTAAKVRLPHHLFPTTWSPRSYVRFGAVLAATIAHAWRLGGRSGKLFRLVTVWAAVIVAWVAYAFIAERLGSPAMLVMQPGRATDFWYCFAGPTLIVCAAGILLTGRVAWERRVAVLIALVVLVMGAVSFGRRVEKRGSVRAALVWRPGFAERQVAAWARTHTSRDVAFLVNPNWGDFRGLSKRPVFTTWKDGSAILWDRPFASEWVERMRALGYDITRRRPPGTMISKQLDTIYDGVTDTQALSLAHRYHLSYRVVPAKKASRLPVVYSNRFYKVLDIRPLPSF